MTRRVLASVSLLSILVLGLTGKAKAQFGPQPIYVGIPSFQVNFAAASQQENEWCWAASTQMILGLYGIPASQGSCPSSS